MHGGVADLAVPQHSGKLGRLRDDLRNREDVLIVEVEHEHDDRPAVEERLRQARAEEETPRKLPSDPTTPRPAAAFLPRARRCLQRHGLTRLHYSALPGRLTWRPGCAALSVPPATVGDMTPTTVEAVPDVLVAMLRRPVWNTLAERADGIRRCLPVRPETAVERFAWLRSLSPEQARRAALLDRLDALCGHLAGHPALGHGAEDPMPEAALQEAEGFNPQLTALIAAYRAARGVPDTATG